MSRMPTALASAPQFRVRQALGLQGLLLLGNGGVGSGHSPVSAAGSVSIASGEERLVHTLHIGLQDRASGNPRGAHSAAIGMGSAGGPEPGLSQPREQDLQPEPTGNFLQVLGPTLDRVKGL